VLLWKDICSNKLLANVDLVLFLNKCDILDKKLKSGIRLAKYVRSYGDRPNDLESTSKCMLGPGHKMIFRMLIFDFVDLRSKFNAIQREYSPHPRKFYAFCTSVTVSTVLSPLSVVLVNPVSGLSDDVRDLTQW
jgi:guanine nucleotide-binding protein alpha-1 subunit